VNDSKVLQAKEAYVEGQYDLAIKLASECLDKDVNDAQALFVIGGVFIQTQRRGLAHQIMARCLKICEENKQPRSEVWINYGRTLDDSIEGWAETEYCMLRALELKPDSRAAYENLSALETQRCNPEKALEYADKALAIDDTSNVALSAKGFALLMLGRWEEAWNLYHVMVGHWSRPEILLGDLPEWDGSKGKSVVVTGEQGIGDELIYFSMIPDMARDCKWVVLDGMPRLSALLQRSMPANVWVSGQRWEDTLEVPDYIKPDARITAAGVGMYYRKTDADFPGTPYLRADDNMRVAMRAMLASYGDMPKIGIAWTGGTDRSRKHWRQSSLEALTPLLRTPGVMWVSLQYNPALDEIKAYKKARGIQIHHYPWVTEEKEYDHTAALVAELDLVISVPTSVVQLAGGMGVPTWVMVPEITGWLYHRDTYVWADAVKLYRNQPPQVLADDLQSFLNAKRQEAA
jgi:hypothetical protein